MHCFLAMFLSACDVAPQSTTSEVATLFVQALNQDNLDVLTDHSELPFYIYSQQWNTAGDGHGFVLGEKKKTILNNKGDVSAYMRSLIRDLETESIDAQYIPVAEYSRFQEELGATVTMWESQDVFLFLRGMGDVEHIIMLGVNRKTKKIQQLYFN